MGALVQHNSAGPYEVPHLQKYEINFFKSIHSKDNAKRGI